MGKKVYWYEKDKRVVLKEESVSTVTDADVIISGKKADGAEAVKVYDESGFIGNAKQSLFRGISFIQISQNSFI